MDDSISRKAAIEAIKEDKIDLTNPNVVAVFKATGDFEKAETQVMTCDRHIKILKELPSMPSERKHGKWHITDAYPHNVYCTECYTRFAQTHWAVWKDGSLPRNFCPNCGADMREVDDEFN